jgi:phosphatidylglycerol:prolipoprotein diacylglycerol transferase
MRTALMVIPWFRLEPWIIPLPLLGALPIQPFGVLAAISIIVGVLLAELRAPRAGVPLEHVQPFFTHIIMVGLGCAAALNVLFYEPDKLGEMARAVSSWLGSGPREPFPYPGLSSFGGFLGGALAAVWYARSRRVSLLALGDLFCFVFPCAWVIARLGCFVVHDHPGAPSDFLLAVDDYNGEGIARHDLGLYEALWALAMTPLVLWLGRRSRPLGFFTALVPIAYAVVRFFLDFLRAPAEHGGDVRYLGLTPGHYASIAMLIAGLVVSAHVSASRRP